VPRAHPHTRHAPGRGARRLDPHPIFSGLAASCPEEGSPGRVTAEFPSCRIPAAPSQHPRPAAAIVATRLGMVPDAVVRHLYIRSITVRSQLPPHRGRRMLLPACSPTCMPANAGLNLPMTVDDMHVPAAPAQKSRANFNIRREFMVSRSGFAPCRGMPGGPACRR